MEDKASVALFTPSDTMAIEDASKPTTTFIKATKRLTITLKIEVADTTPSLLFGSSLKSLYIKAIFKKFS